MHLFMQFFAPLDSDLGDAISGRSRTISGVMTSMTEMPILGRAGESMDKVAEVRAREESVADLQARSGGEEVLATTRK